MQTGRLHGMNALITGGSRGIGAAVARAFVAQGAAVAVAHEPTDAMTALADGLVNELVDTGGRAIAIAGDLATVEGPAAVVEQARAALGPLDTVVANAAASGRCDWHCLEVADWDLVQNVNVRATWLLAKAARIDLAASRNGSVISLSSVMMMTGQAGALHYTTSKAAVLGLTRALAREWGPDGVRVNAVMPGAIRTEQEVEMSPDPVPALKWALERQSLQRRGVAEDLAGAFVFLASAEAGFVTGQVICVDGGWVMY